MNSAFQNAAAKLLLQEIYDMWKSGFSEREIASAHGLGIKLVRQVLAERGVEPEPTILKLVQV